MGEEQQQAQGQEQVQSQEPINPDADLVPIQKYFVIQKLQQLNLFLSDRSDPAAFTVESVLKFAPYLSYETLVKIVYRILIQLQTRKPVNSEVKNVQ